MSDHTSSSITQSSSIPYSSHATHYRHWGLSMYGRQFFLTDSPFKASLRDASTWLHGPSER